MENDYINTAIIVKALRSNADSQPMAFIALRDLAEAGGVPPSEMKSAFNFAVDEDFIDEGPFNHYRLSVRARDID